MDLQSNINYSDLLQLIQKMSFRELSQLKTDIDTTIQNKLKKKNEEDFPALLLSGPVILDEQHEQYLENRKLFNQWRKN